MFFATCICMLCMLSCATSKKVSDRQTVVINDTVRNQYVVFDTVTVQIADSAKAEGKDIVKQTDIDYEHQLDSMAMANALKDKRIATLLSQIANKDLHMDAIHSDVGSAHAVAGVDNNKLWLNLNVDSITTVNTNTVDQTTINNSKEVNNNTEVTKQYSCWTSPWFYGFWLLAILCVLLLIIVIKKTLRL